MVWTLPEVSPLVDAVAVEGQEVTDTSCSGRRLPDEADPHVLGRAHGHALIADLALAPVPIPDPHAAGMNATRVGAGTIAVMKVLHYPRKRTSLARSRALWSMHLLETGTCVVLGAEEGVAVIPITPTPHQVQVNLRPRRRR